MYTIDEIEELARRAKLKSLGKTLFFLLIALAFLGFCAYEVIKNLGADDQPRFILIYGAGMLVLVYVAFSVPDKKYKDTKKRLEDENAEEERVQREEHDRRMEEMMRKMWAQADKDRMQPSKK